MIRMVPESSTAKMAMFLSIGMGLLLYIVVSCRVMTSSVKKTTVVAKIAIIEIRRLVSRAKEVPFSVVVFAEP
jgi:hypothetical protein